MISCVRASALRKCLGKTWIHTKPCIASSGSIAYHALGTRLRGVEINMSRRLPPRENRTIVLLCTLHVISAILSLPINSMASGEQGTSSQLDHHVLFRKDTNIFIVETFKPGYPRYAALLSTHSNFQVWRRFTRVRARLALRKQDDIARLEEQLDTIDREEMHDLFLGCHRKDTNEERWKVVRELTTTLSEYGMECIF
jgi:hypothetical protein